MKLTPPDLYDLVKKNFPYEGDWHYARMDENADLRAVMPGIAPFSDVRQSGKQFLVHLREMSRVYKFLSKTKVTQDSTKTWKDVPHHVIEEIGAGHFDVIMKEISRLIVDGTENQLGGFISGTMAYTPQTVSFEYAGLFGKMCRALSAYDRQEKTFTDDSSMDDPCYAHLNPHFWGMIGWIDNQWAAWQKRHNQLADQSEITPQGIMGVRISSRDKYADQSICGSFAPLAKRPKAWLAVAEWKAEFERRKAAGEVS